MHAWPRVLASASPTSIINHFSEDRSCTAVSYPLLLSSTSTHPVPYTSCRDFIVIMPLPCLSSSSSSSCAVIFQCSVLLSLWPAIHKPCRNFLCVPVGNLILLASSFSHNSNSFHVVLQCSYAIAGIRFAERVLLAHCTGSLGSLRMRGALEPGAWEDDAWDHEDCASLNMF